MTKQWSDASILRSMPNPNAQGYEIEITNPEVTFFGAGHQPDFATAVIVFYPGQTVIELKSLKIYFQQFRDKIMSYERLINVIFNDLMEKYRPQRLKITMTFLPRGGISSKLTIDSAWKIRGGSLDC